MTEQEAKERTDMIVKKVRDLIVLEDQVLEAREVAHKLSIIQDKIHTTDLQEDVTEHQKILTKLESELKTCFLELDRITDELKSAAPCFRTHVLLQMNKLVEMLKSCDETEQHEFIQLATALTDEEGNLTADQLEVAIIARLKDNIERIFSIK